MSSSSSAPAPAVGAAPGKKFVGDSSFGYKALRDFRAALPAALARIPADAASSDFASVLRATVTEHRDTLEKKLRGFNLDDDIVQRELEIFRVGGEETYAEELKRRMEWEKEQEERRRAEREAAEARAKAEADEREAAEARAKAEADERDAEARARKEGAAAAARAAEEAAAAAAAARAAEEAAAAARSDPASAASPAPAPSPAPSPAPASAAAAAAPSPVPAPAPAPAPVVYDPDGEWKDDLLSSADLLAMLRKILKRQVLDPLDVQWGVALGAVTAPPAPLPSASTTPATSDTAPTPAPAPTPTPAPAASVVDPAVLRDRVLFVRRSDLEGHARRLLEGCGERAKRTLYEIRTSRAPNTLNAKAEAISRFEKECTPELVTKATDEVRSACFARIASWMSERDVARAEAAKLSFERVMPLAHPSHCHCGLLATHTELFAGKSSTLAQLAPARRGGGEAMTEEEARQKRPFSARLKSLAATVTAKAKAFAAKASAGKPKPQHEEEIEARNESWSDERASSVMTIKAGSVQGTGGFATSLATGVWNAARALLEGTKRESRSSSSAASKLSAASSAGGTARLPYLDAEMVYEEGLPPGEGAGAAGAVARPPARRRDDDSDDDEGGGGGGGRDLSDLEDWLFEACPCRRRPRTGARGHRPRPRPLPSGHPPTPAASPTSAAASTAPSAAVTASGPSFPPTRT
jgi:hypothetical protein